MALSSEDSLRLNVLLATEVQAIRIDEGRMTVYGLTPQGEAKVHLNPNSRDDIYLREVREMLSGHVLGSPGGYPVYLERWTRMGQARDESLQQLLLLGEPEAVVAVANAPGLTDELARRAWWSAENADNARCMLERPAIVNGKMGKVLANFLVEFLPFEEDHLTMIRSIRLVLQGQLISSDMRSELWRRAAKKNAFYLGFMQALPDQLHTIDDRPVSPLATDATLQQLCGDGNVYALLLQRLLSPAGQSWLFAAGQVLKKPINQDVVLCLFETLAGYCAAVRPSTLPDEEDLPASIEFYADCCRHCADSPVPEPEHLQALLNALPGAHDHVVAMMTLAGLGYGPLRPIFSRTSAIGSLMRKRIAPVTSLIGEQLQVLAQPLATSR